MAEKHASPKPGLVSSANLTNASSPYTPYFTPHHLNTPGGAIPAISKSNTNTNNNNIINGGSSKIPTLFHPLTIRNVTLRNRILVAPMCQYSTASRGDATGSLTDYHISTLGHYALKGAALVFIEATGVQPRGRISPNCPGLWTDAQIGGVKRVADFVRSQGSVIGIQLAHAGRKASTVAPWISAAVRKDRGLGPGSWRAADDDGDNNGHGHGDVEGEGGWQADVVGPMGGEGETWDELVPGRDEGSGYCVPRGLTEAEIDELVADWGRAAKRAVAAGVQVIEIHAAHGYLLHQFLSPVTNRRRDGYGGSWEKRVRLLKEVVHEVRANIPDDMPLFVRVSATEWLEGTDVEKRHVGDDGVDEDDEGVGKSWTVKDTIRLAGLLPEWGVDLLDVSSGGNHPAQKIDMFKSKDYQVKIARRIRAEMKRQGKKLLIGAVGLITEAQQAREIVEESGKVGGVVDDDDDRDDQENMSIAQEAKAAVAMTQKKADRVEEGDGEPMADVILVARQFMREPEWVLRVAWQLGVEVGWPNQFLRVRFPKL